jgi:hypothetical protein
MLANLTDRNPTAADVIDRVLDKGIVVDVLVRRVSLSGIDLPVTVHAGFIVTSIDTYLERVDASNTSSNTRNPASCGKQMRGFRI